MLMEPDPDLSVALEVRDLTITVAYTGHPVVEETSFSLDRGEILGLVGESGSGKTTLGLGLLAHCRRGLKITKGEVKIGSYDLIKIAPEALPRIRKKLISYVPQDPGTALNPTLKIRTQLVECFDDPRTATNQQLLQLLDEVKLPTDLAFLDAYPHQMSGGQLQRVAIAMAFASRPRVIVMDEPTTGLDVTTQARVLQTVRQLCEIHQVGVVYVTHDLAVVASLAHRAAVMYAGRIIELGPTARVLRDPYHPYTRALINAVPDLARRNYVQGIPGQAPEPYRRPPGCAFAPRCRFDIPACRIAMPAERVLSTDHMVRCLRPGMDEVKADEHSPFIDFIANGGKAPVLKVPVLKVPVLRVENLIARYGSTEILHGITLTVPEQACVALVGESGSGKTTLGRAVGGLHREFDGLVQFRGLDLAAGSRNRGAVMRRCIQYIFQNPYASLNPRRSIGRSIGIALQEFESISGTRLQCHVAEVLNQAALPDHVANRYPHQLSGGQRQRAAIARALIVKPELLICDEVTSALDVSVQAVVITLLAKLQRERQLSMLFITHNLALVRSIAQFVAVMHKGRIIEMGTVDQVLNQPQMPETQRLLKDAPRFANEVVR